MEEDLTENREGKQMGTEKTGKSGESHGDGTIVTYEIIRLQYLLVKVSTLYSRKTSEGK